MAEFKPPKDELLHAMWIIRNISASVGNCQSPERVLSSIHELAKSVFDKFHTEK